MDVFEQRTDVQRIVEVMGQHFETKHVLIQLVRLLGEYWLKNGLEHVFSYALSACSRRLIMSA